MHLFKLFALAASFLCIHQVAAAVVEKRSSHSFAGSNSYFLHAISADYQSQYIEALAAKGAKVVRLWSNVERLNLIEPLAKVEVSRWNIRWMCQS